METKFKGLFRVVYGLFIAFSFYFALVNNDYGSAASNMGIALIFDPFDEKVSWQNRPL